MVLMTFSYLSRLLAPLSDEAVAAIRRSSEEYNLAQGVTGLLLHDGRHFAQIIEGPEAGLARVRARIMRDPRHELVEVGPAVAVARRQFEGWSLRVVSRPAPVTGTLREQLGERLGFRVHPELVDFFLSGAAAAADAGGGPPA